LTSFEDEQGLVSYVLFQIQRTPGGSLAFSLYLNESTENGSFQTARLSHDNTIVPFVHYILDYFGHKQFIYLSFEEILFGNKPEFEKPISCLE